MDKTLIGSAIGCIIALAMWKATRENVVLSLCGVFVIALMIVYGSHLPFPFDWFVFILGFAVLGVGKYVLVEMPMKRKPKNKNNGAQNVL